MKAIIRFLFLTLLYSCDESSENKDPIKPIDENLQIVFKKTSKHTYTKSQLLDTTYQTDSAYFKGIFTTDINLIITRNYDNNNNLLSEKTFQAAKTNDLTEEKIFNYDTRNNLISEIDKVDGITRSIIKRYYNDHNQEIKTIDIQADLTEIIHNRSNPVYDTIISIKSYDSQGNVIKQTTGNPNNVVHVTSFTIYSNGEKRLRYGIDKNGDTVSTSQYKKMGDLIEETMIDKSDPNSYIKTWYDGKKIMRRFFYDFRSNKKRRDNYKYDEMGNEIEHISYQ
jgi:antitoxin component YwqK of YwqJK toxin-antitoxin module